MRRIPMWVMLTVAVLALLRKMTGSRSEVSVAQRVAQRCERMMADMPPSFPPNRMMADLEAIKETTARILEQLEEPTKEPDRVIP